MSLLDNYEAGFELSEGVVKQIFEEAYSAGEIPHEIQKTVTEGGNTIDVIVKIMQATSSSTLALDFSTCVTNGIKMSLPLDIEANIQNSLAPSINPVKFSAGLDLTAPVQGLPDSSGNKELVLNLAGLPDSQVVVGMPGSEVIPIDADLIADGLHAAYDSNIIPHTVPYGVVMIDVIDDDANPSRQIKFQMDSSDTGTMTLPVTVHIGGSFDDNLIIHNIRLIRSGDNLTIRFSGISANDIETGPLLATQKALIAAMISTYPDYTVFVPSNNTIASWIQSAAKSRLNTWGADGNGRLHLYTPNAVENTPINIVDFDVVVKSGFLGVLFNPKNGTNPGDVDNFIPTSKKFAQALSESKFQEMADTAITEKILNENGCGGWPCTFDHKIEGHKVTLTNKPTFTLHDGYIKMNGSCSVEIDCWFDPDVDYEAKIKFHFDVDGDGNKVIVPDVYDEDVSLSCLDWFLGLIILIYGWICLAIVNSVIGSVGGEVVSAEGDKIAQGTKYLAGEIHGIGGVTTDLDRIDIKPGGIILSGGTFIASATYPLTIAQSESGAPYSGWAACMIPFQAFLPHPQGKYEWDFADGNIGSGKNVNHLYMDDGIYIFKLTTEVIDPYGRTTHHFGRVKVKNNPPQVNAGPDLAAFEGDVIPFTGQFSDAEWVDTHVARWDYGDKSCQVADITETNNPPQALGKAVGQHAYGDNDDYTVRLQVIDDDGGEGIDTLHVKVKNVPPKVDAGDFVYAYPGIPIRLVAHFTDPGWLDTHVGQWEFGDFSPASPATIKELNNPPMGTGLAVSTHIYQHCGNYQAICTVIDDDNGVGGDDVIVHVVEMRNLDFESGFRQCQVGKVANDWEPFAINSAGNVAATIMTVAADIGEIFDADEFLVHSGQRSQKIGGGGAFHAGIYQQIGANPGWDYQANAFYHIDERGGGTCALGIDPAGGIDPTSPQVVWLMGREQKNWVPLQVRTTATERRITVFLLAEGSARDAAYFDDVTLLPYPCPLEDPLPPPESEPKPEPTQVCVDWNDEREAKTLGPTHHKGGFSFQAADQADLRLILWGDPHEQAKLYLGVKGLRCSLPFPGERVWAQVGVYNDPVSLKVYDVANTLIAETMTSDQEGGVQVLELEATGMTYLAFSGGGGEAFLVRLCVTRGAHSSKKFTDEL